MSFIWGRLESEVDRRAQQFNDYMMYGHTYGKSILEGKLTKEDVKKIKTFLKVGGHGCQTEIAKRFNVTSSHINAIKQNRSWSHIKI